EFLIHQRFFAKLKQKAEIKRRELEESRRRGKENIQKEQLNVINQERLLRKRRTPAGNDTLSSSPTTQDGEENATSQGTEEEHPTIMNDKPDNITAQASVGITEMIKENGNEKLNHTEVVATKQSKEKPGEKKMRITNGFDEVGVIKQEDANEAMSLAKYLAESVQSQAAEQHQSQEIMEVDVTPVQEKERDRDLEIERERLKEEERNRSREIEREKAKEREREKIRQMEQEQRTTSGPSTKAASQKEPEAQHKSALTSVFHSLKDIFFGKSKKSTDTAETTKRTTDINVEKDIPHEKHLPPSQTPSQESLVDSEASKLEAPKLIQEPQMVDLEVKTKPFLQTQDSGTPNDISISEHGPEFHANKPEDVSPTLESEHVQSIGATLRLSLQEKEIPKEESSPEEVPQVDQSLLFEVSSSRLLFYNLPVLSICSAGLPAPQHMGVIYREYICATRLEFNYTSP
ncbi:hypothetical protein M9458_036405, partial [Cirrhinus mrigala]